MTLKMKLQQKQTQSLVMTQALAQSIKLLQLSHVELLDFVKEEVEKNPLLELGADASDPHLSNAGANDIAADKQVLEAEAGSAGETLLITKPRSPALVAAPMVTVPELLKIPNT